METKVDSERLAKLGFSSLSEKAKKLQERKRKLAVAYEYFRFVRQEKVSAFNEKLKEETKSGGGFFTAYKTLAFRNIKDYDKMPPEPVLVALEEAQRKSCFDSYEIASIEEVKDPILFGRIEGCTDRFFIAQWDDDVKIEDIIADHEG